MTTRLTGRILLLSVTAAAASSPVTIDAGGLRIQEAACQDGTCCYEEKSTCVIGSHAESSYYYKPHSSCKLIQN